MPTLLESLGAPPQSVVPTSVMEPTEPLPPPAPAPASDPFEAAGWEEVKAAPDPFEAAGWEEVKAEPDPFEAAGWKEADDLDTKSVEELAASRDTFNPKEYYASHPELFSDPKKAAKFLDVYRIRDEEGLDAGQVAKAAVKEALPTVGKVAGGVRDVVEGAINVGLQPIANVFGGILTGDIFNKQRREELIAETQREQKRGVAQFGAGSEASATGIADIARQGIRKLPKPTGDMQDATFEESMSGRPRVRKTDQELLQQITADVEFGNQLGEIVQGRGEAAKAVGLDADTLAKEGITLDPEVIERLSLVDPLTIIAGGGIFKGVTAAGKTAFTASTRAAAEAAMQRLTQVATRAATAPIRGIGKGVELTGALAKKVAPIAPTVGMVSGGVSGGLPGAGAGYLAGVGAQRTLRIGGKILESGGRGISAAGEALGNSRILQQTLRGTAEGVIATAPLAAATDDDLAAGTLLGAGGLLGGGIRGAIATAEAPALAISRSRLAPKNIVYPETRSPGYGRDKSLDAVHAEEIKTLPQAAQNEINSFRETARKLGAELYFLDDANFAIATQENAARALKRELTGQEKVDLGRTAESEGFFDFDVPVPGGESRRVLFLRKSADLATHEVGHLFFKTLAPERQAELVQSVRDSYTPEQIERVRIDQSQRLGEDVSTNYAINEIAADTFSQVFRNTPVSELTAPPGLLQEIRRNVTDFAENLGLDLTAGERTDSVGVASSLRFNDVVRDAARELLSPKPRQPVVTPKAAPITLEQAARDLGPLVEPRVAKQTPARPTPEAGATPDAGAAPEATPEAVVDEARKIADEAPDTTLPGAAMSQKEILGTVAEIIAGKGGARYNYRNAPDVPGAAEEASRAPRRVEIEKARNMPEDLRRMTETTGIPYRIVKSSGGVVQVLDWAPDMLASNALRVAKALSELALKHPTNPVLKKIKYELDVQKGEWTEQGWRDIFADAEIFSANQGKGFTGSGLSLEFPPEVVAAGRTAPAVTGTPVPLEQGIADFQNMLYNLRVPKTPRQGAKLPGNLVSQKISEATLPGRLRQPALVEPRKASETGVRKPFKIDGKEVRIQDPNPLRAEFETALQAKGIPLPDGIEVVRRLNLEHIADVVAEPNLPKTVGGVTPVLEAGFAAPEREWRISGQRRGAKAQVTVKAPDIASARRLAEAQGLRVATVEAADKMTNAMFAAPKTKSGRALEERGFEIRHTGGPANPGVSLIKDGVQAGDISAVRKSPTEADISLIHVDKDFRGQGLSEILYREMGKRLQDEGVENVTGMIINPKALASRNKAFPDTQIEGIAEFPGGEVSTQVRSPITPESQFAAPRELADRVERFTPDEFRAWVRDEAGNSFTGVAYDVGRNAPDQDFVDSLKQRYDNSVSKSTELITAISRDPAAMVDKMDDLSARISQGQFFREAHEAATGTASAGKSLRETDPDYVPPFPPEEAAFAAPKKAKDKYALKPPSAGFSKAWILPTGEPVQLGGKWHHQWLAENPDVAAKYNLDVPEFTGNDTEMVREGALKAGFARVAHTQRSGSLTVEARAKDWRKVKGAVERMVESNLDSIDNMHVTLMDETATKVVDSLSAKLFEFDDAEKLQHIPFITEGEVRGQFAAPKSEGELGIVLPKDEARLNRKFNAMVAASKEKYPEAIPLELKKDENGNYQLDKDGKPKPVEMEYGLFETPLAKAAAKGKRGDDAREAAIADAYAAKIETAHAEAMKNPEIAAGADWYSLARTKLRTLFGDDTKFFTELLAATSAQTDVPTNFRYSIDAYNRFKQGEYDTQIAKYKEGKLAWENRRDGLLQGMDLPVDVTRAKFIETWIEKYNLKPTQSNGKLFGANSDSVLKVLDGSWREELGGLKTGQFNDNLTGASFGATIDVWAARALHRMGNEGNPKRWRILPKNERAVADADFHLAQKAFQKAADGLGLSPDSLQAILWFAEKDYYGKKGWTRAAGAAKTDFNVLLEVTARGKSGSGKLVIDKAALAKKAAPKEKAQLDFDLGMD